MSDRKPSRPMSKYSGVPGQWRCGVCGRDPTFSEQTSQRSLERHILVHHRRIGRHPDPSTWTLADDVEARVVRLRKSQGRRSRQKTNERYFGRSVSSTSPPSVAAALAAQIFTKEDGHLNGCQGVRVVHFPDEDRRSNSNNNKEDRRSADRRSFIMQEDRRRYKNSSHQRDRSSLKRDRRRGNPWHQDEEEEIITIPAGMEPSREDRLAVAEGALPPFVLTYPFRAVYETALNQSSAREHFVMGRGRCTAVPKPSSGLGAIAAPTPRRINVLSYFDEGWETCAAGAACNCICLPPLIDTSITTPTQDESTLLDTTFGSYAYNAVDIEKFLEEDLKDTCAASLSSEAGAINGASNERLEELMAGRMGSLCVEEIMAVFTAEFERSRPDAHTVTETSRGVFELVPPPPLSVVTVPVSSNVRIEHGVPSSQNSPASSESEYVILDIHAPVHAEEESAW